MRERAGPKSAEEPWSTSSWTTAPPLTGPEPQEMLDLDEAPSRLSIMDARAARVVGFRYFVGLEMEEAAAVLGVSERTVKRDWVIARAWLSGELRK